MQKNVGRPLTRRYGRRRELIRSLVLVAASALACDRGPGTTHTESSDASASRLARAPTKASERLSPFVRLARQAALEALGHARKLRAAELGRQCQPTATYLALRRAVALGKPWWRQGAGEAVEVLLGPLRPVVEGGGHLGLLDAALASGDCAAARRSAYQVEQALRLIGIQLGRSLGIEFGARAWCDTAVELGEILLESHPEVGITPAGVLADAEGTLDAIEQGGAAFVADRASMGQSSAYFADVTKQVQLLRDRLRATPHELSGRGKLVLVTGKLGALLRRVARDLGIPVEPPFLPRVRTTSESFAEPVSTLTVPAPRSIVDSARVLLGRRLFSDVRLSADQRRSCASCHDPGRAFSDGLARPASMIEGVTLRNTPTLLYASAQAAQLWDGRVITSARQALRVIHSPAEMGIDKLELQRRLRADAALSSEFARLFADGVTADNVAAVLSEFQIAKLVPARAPIDRFARGEVDALSVRELAGLDVFAGPGRCARCHVPPLFGGTRPNDFAVTVYAAIGTTTDSTGRTLDADPGRKAVTGDPLDDRSFKTPTLRSVARTSPYFHNGGFQSLESVVDFYDRGGGRGFGHHVPNQDPEVRPLKLSAEQRAALLLFLRRPLTDPGVALLL